MSVYSDITRERLEQIQPNLAYVSLAFTQFLFKHVFYSFYCYKCLTSVIKVIFFPTSIMSLTHGISFNS